MQLYDICPELQPFVKLICSMECDNDADTDYIRVLPDTCIELFINYTSTPVAIIGNELYQRSIITSRMSRPMDVQMRKGSGCLAICFYPGMAYKFFHLSMQEFTDNTIRLDEVWKGRAEEIEDKVAEASDNFQRVTIIQQYLLRQLAQSTDDEYVTRCLQHVQSWPDNLTVAQLTYKTSLSQRHLSRRFQQCVGLSPKEYLKVNRFLRSLKHLKEYPGSSLTEVSYRSGYYDQAHFIRDCRTYTGHTPREVVLSSDILY